MFSVVTKYHKGRHSLFLYNSEIFYAFTQDILRSRSVRFNSYLGNRFDDNLTTLENDTYILLTGGKGSWGVAYKKALDAFKKFKMSKYSSYTDSEAKDTAKAFHLLIEQNA